ncbi:MAG: hypothetical protein HFJ94_01195 [Muribaculaceae bacterium]|jgi:hypothetical protein|nr:hypothetical protein [Muribaculaceae bacterium]
MYKRIKALIKVILCLEMMVVCMAVPLFMFPYKNPHLLNLLGICVGAAVVGKRMPQALMEFFDDF